MSEVKKIMHDIEAEEAVVGGCIYGNEYLHRINPQLRVDDFYSERHMWLFQAILTLDENNINLNEITIGDEINKMGKVDATGGRAYLAHLLAIVPSPEDIVSYADVVRRLSILRKLTVAGDMIKDLAVNSNGDLSETLNKADNIILDVRKHGVPSPIITPNDRKNLLLTRYLNLYETEKVAARTGLSHLDFLLGGGLFNGDVIIVGARPGMGKTAFLQTLANNMARDRVVLFCSGEMTIEGLSDRDIAGEVGISTHAVRIGGYPDEIYEKITQIAVENVTSRKVYYYKDSPLTISKILQQCISMKMRFGLDAVFIDYLGMLDDEYGKSQYERVGYLSRKIKQLAYKIDVPVVAAHQLNRDVQGRNDKRPQLQDLRDSGKVEEDADVVMFLYRDSYYNDTSTSLITEVIVAKQRQGESNKTIKVLFDKNHQRYVNLEEERIEEN